uniref:Uncharacterized protein n=1 Tax=Timema cristinae TaxID=61476 RepID=A0A7R9DE31_TIMCR|nr:unnamed protein product [Timema cristinae]
MPFKCGGSYAKLSNLIRHKHQCHQTPPTPAHQNTCWDEELLCGALDLNEKEEYNRVKCLNKFEKNKSYNVVLSEETINEPNVIVPEFVGRIRLPDKNCGDIVNIRSSASQRVLN